MVENHITSACIGNSIDVIFGITVGKFSAFDTIC